MAERDPNLPQSADPELQANLVRLLQVQGPLGMLNVLDVVIPTVSLGQVVPLDVEVRQPAFRASDVFSAGEQTAPAALSVLADTGQLAEGTYDVQVHMSTTESANGSTFLVQHRNAANAASLMQATYSFASAGGTKWFILNPFAYVIAANERLRVLNRVAGGAGDLYSVMIFARRRT